MAQYRGPLTTGQGRVSVSGLWGTRPNGRTWPAVETETTVPPLPRSVEKLSSTKLVPGAKNVGDRWFNGQGSLHVWSKEGSGATPQQTSDETRRPARLRSGCNGRLPIIAGNKVSYQGNQQRGTPTRPLWLQQALAGPGARLSGGPWGARAGDAQRARGRPSWLSWLYTQLGCSRSPVQHRIVRYP